MIPHTPFPFLPDYKILKSDFFKNIFLSSTLSTMHPIWIYSINVYWIELKFEG